MAEPEKDLAPETEPEPTPEPEKETPPTPPTPPESSKPSDGEKIPEWGQALSNKLDGLIEQLKPPMPPDGEEIPDANPVKPPWHKRGFFGS